MDYYKQLLGNNVMNRKGIIQQIVQGGPMITDEHRNILNAPYNADEV